MRAGRLRHRVNLQVPVEVQDSFGEAVLTYVSVASSIPAEVLPLRGKEYFQAQAVQAEGTHRVELRYRMDVTPRSRLLWEGRYLEVEYVEDVGGRHRQLFLTCKEVVP